LLHFSLFFYKKWIYMSFRQYGGINYAARNNIVRNNYSNANNLSIMTKVGQPASYINFESDISGNASFYGDLSLDGSLTITGTNSSGIDNGIIFPDGSSQNKAVTSSDSYWVEYVPSASIPTIYYTSRVLIGADPSTTVGTIDSGTKLAINGNLSVSNVTSGKAGVIQLSDYSITPTATLRIASYNGINYIESGVNSDSGSSAPLYFTNFNGANKWMTISSTGNVGIGTTTPAYKLDVNGNMNVTGTTTLIGIPTAPTASPLNNSTQISTTAYVDSAVAAISGGSVTTTVYTTSTTISYLPLFKRLTITCIGGGGGGGLSSISNTYGGAGGTGAAVFTEILNSVQQPLDIVIGVPGEKATIIGTSGGTGGSSSVTCVATGYSMTASGGSGGSPTTGGYGGVASGTYLYKLDGINGLNSGFNFNSQPLSTYPLSSVSGSASYGGGGNGGWGISGTIFAAAGNGTTGCVILTYYY
jgi:hypothetical protein